MLQFSFDRAIHITYTQVHNNCNAYTRLFKYRAKYIYILI